MNPLIAPDAGTQVPRTALSVNVNKVALLRNTRHLGIPSVRRAATLVLEAGAQGVTVHPRPDERHIRGSDVHELAALLRDWPAAEYNIEGNPFHNLMDFVRSVRPQQCTFVPDSVGQFTSDHGWNLAVDAERLAPLIAEARALGVRVSLFMDADAAAMRLAAAGGAAPRARDIRPALKPTPPPPTRWGLSPAHSPAHAPGGAGGGGAPPFPPPPPRALAAGRRRPPPTASSSIPSLMPPRTARRVRARCSRATRAPPRRRSPPVSA